MHRKLETLLRNRKGFLFLMEGYLPCLSKGSEDQVVRSRKLLRFGGQLCTKDAYKFAYALFKATENRK